MSSAVVEDRRIAEAVLSSRTRGAVWSILGPYGLGQDTEDVIADAAEAAVKSASLYDPALGPVEAWVLTIAKRRAYDHVKRVVAGGRLQGRLEAAADGPDISLNVSLGDFSDDVVDRLDGAAQAREVLGLTASLIANPVSFRRVAALWMSYQGDTNRASAALGIAPAALRDSCREVRRCAHVVRKALDAVRAGVPVTVGSLVECLPAGAGEDGVWARALSVATVRAGGFGKVTATDLVAVTGYSLNTCRQYMTEALWLLQVARTVMEPPPEKHPRHEHQAAGPGTPAAEHHAHQEQGGRPQP